MRLVICFLLLCSEWVAGQQQPGVTFRRNQHDFGTISEKNGPVSFQFFFKNNTDAALKIQSVESSCGCTIAEWTKVEVMPGKEGQIKAVYDPTGRPGYFSKSITVTFSPDSTPVVLQIRGHVSESGEKLTERFDHTDGQLKTRSSGFNLGKVYINQEPILRTFTLFNSGSKELKITNIQAPDYLKVNHPEMIQPGESATLSIKVNTKQKNEFGFHTDQLLLLTNDPENPEKHFSILYTIEEFFPVLSPDALEKAPSLTLSVSEIKFQTLHSSGVLERTVLFRNTGKQTLKIRSLVPNCTCLEAVLDQDSVPPGGSGKINIKFKPGGRTGRQIKSVVIYSNDPQHPVQKISVNGLVSGD
jgi:hypothetical protein